MFVVAIYLLVKIFRIVHFKGDPALILSITSISLALACMITFFILDTIRNLEDSFIQFDIYLTIVTEIDQLKVMFLFLSLVFDVYKWSIFLASTGLQNSPTYFEDRERLLTKILIVVQVTMMALQTGIIAKVLEVGFTKAEDSPDLRYWMNFQKISNSSIFLLFFLVYIVILSLLTTRLKSQYPKFYQKERKSIVITNSIIIASILLRITLYIVYSIDYIYWAL